MSFQVDIKNAAGWKQEVLDVAGTCQVVEVYSSWAGPCKCIVSTFKRIFFDSGDAALKFFTVDSGHVPGFEEYAGACQPVFLFYKDGKLIDKVVGVVAPELERKIAEYSLPSA